MRKNLAVLVLIIAAAVPRLPLAAEYRRDPFVPLIGLPGRFVAGGLEEVRSIDEIKLKGIISDEEQRKTAIINDAFFKEGDEVGIIKIIKIKEEEVILSLGGKEYLVGMSEKKEREQ